MKTLLLGGTIGILSVLLGLSVAKADCSQDSGERSYAAARLDAELCDTNYAEVVRVDGGFEAYCMPDATAEACIEVSGRLDCSDMSAERCDEVMGVMFDACVQLASAGAQ